MTYTKHLDIPSYVYKDINDAMVDRRHKLDKTKTSKFFSYVKFKAYASSDTKEWITNNDIDPRLVAWFIKRGDTSVHPIYCEHCGKELTIKQYLEGHRFCSNICGVLSEEKREKTKKTCIEKYGFDNPIKSDQIKEKLKKSVREKYGVDYVTQLESQKEKSKKTCLERYGVEHYAQSEQFLTDFKQHFLEEYGVENPMRVPSIKEKQMESLSKTTEARIAKGRETNLKRYGVPCTLSLPSIIKKRDERCIELYGVDNIIKSKEAMALIFAKMRRPQYKWAIEYLKERNLTLLETEEEFVKTNIHKFKCNSCGYEFSRKMQKFICCPKCRTSGTSALERSIADFLSTRICIERSVHNICGKHKEIDILIPSLNIGIEVNGVYWHSTKFKDKEYHQEKSASALSNGITIFHFFEYEDLDYLKTVLLRLISNYDAPKTITIKKIDSNCDGMFDDASDYGNLHGLFHDDKLVAFFDLNANRFENFKSLSFRLLKDDIEALKNFLNTENIVISFDYNKPLMVDRELVLEETVLEPNAIFTKNNKIYQTNENCLTVYDCGIKEIHV